MRSTCSKVAMPGTTPHRSSRSYSSRSVRSSKRDSGQTCRQASSSPSVSTNQPSEAQKNIWRDIKWSFMIKTACHYDIRSTPDGLYHHIGIAKGVARSLATDTWHRAGDCIHIQMNMDGLPPFKSSKTQFWPILERVPRNLLKNMKL